MLEPESIEIDARTPDLSSPQPGALGLTEELAVRAFRELPLGGDKAFTLLKGLGLDKAGSPLESTGSNSHNPSRQR